ncbi:MAG TPA: thiamine pyrophosphate-binding protein [Desulfobacteraceae bacterium]|nr:thiamine pyrophosphate-binding protein [Deltaproteobacteria bacterium]HDI61209.1 thiamine pyrophosphate-binding protein [Desulfobacteraceae bacterium]
MSDSTGGQIIAKMLKAEGVEKFFGIVDGTYLQLCAHCVEEGIQMITPRHEAVAAHMAGAYARLSGKLGVCIASNGPGVANMLAGVAVENVEGNRVLLITSSRRTGITYPDRGGAYQCFDQVNVIRNMAKWSATCAYAERIPELLRAALRKCYQGRPGVVHLDVPENLINGPCPAAPILAPERYRRTMPIAPLAEQVEQAAERLIAARLPMIHAGSGVIHAGAFEGLRRVAEQLHAPVTTSWAGRGVLDERHPLAWPMVYIEANNALRNAADACLCLGSDLGETDWWGKAPYWAKTADQQFIQVDIDEERLARNRANDLAIVGDVGLFLEMLTAALDRRGAGVDLAARKARVAELAGLKDEERRKLDEMLSLPGDPMISCQVPRVCREMFADDAVVVFDGGNTAVWGNFYTELRCPNSQLGTHHMGHLGAGVGQALGAAAARPDKPVYCLIGDGAMGFNMQEVETAVRHGLKVIFLVLVDRAWGMVKINQIFALDAVKEMFQTALGPDKKGTINTDLGEIAWDELARAMGAFGARAASAEQLRSALEQARAAGTCAVIHCLVNAEAHMMAPGLLHFKAMHQEPAGE